MKTDIFCKQLIAVFLFLLYFPANSQYTVFDQSEKDITDRLKRDLYVLAADSLLGRETGTKGEAMAYNYIISQYKEIGLKSILADNSYLQEFKFKGRNIYEEKLTSLKLNGINYLTESRFFPLKYSANGQVSGELVRVGFGIHAPELNYNDYKDKNNLKGKIFVIELSIPEGFNTNSEYIKYFDLKKRIDTAVSKGAVAILFVNSDPKCENPGKKLPNKLDPAPIPVIFGDSIVNLAIKKNNKIKADIATIKSIIVTDTVDVS